MHYNGGGAFYQFITPKDRERLHEIVVALFLLDGIIKLIPHAYTTA